MFFGRKPGYTNLSMDKARLEIESDASILLIDVRSPEEFRQGHIPGSWNVPVGRIDEIIMQAPDRDAKLFIYCLSGARSHYACAHLVQMGYTNVTNIGGITQWHGAFEATATSAR